MYYADLHMHSTHSDGKLSVEKIIEHAKNRNLKTISITDHDTISGTIEAVQSLNKGSLEVIPGIELSTIYQGEEIHILGYLFDVENKDFAQFIQSTQNHRLERANKMIEKFDSVGIHIDREELSKISQGDSIGRPHFARLLIKMGLVHSINEGFKKYLTPGTATYVERYKLTTLDAIKEIKNANGLSVLAHPGLIKNQGLINQILHMKIDGIEVYHPKNNSMQTREYYQITKENNLFITGGSDNHSGNSNEYPFIGSVKIPYSYVEKLKEKR